MSFPIEPPVEPMLAKLADELPEGGSFLFEPKWDGFRAIVFRGPGKDDAYIQSRDLRPFDRYFPDLRDVFLRLLPDGCVVDGEIVIATPSGLDFNALQLRLHPAASRVAMLAREKPQRERRSLLERTFAGVQRPIHLTAVTEDRALAAEWLERFEGAGLDGVVAKPMDLAYQPGKRAM